MKRLYDYKLLILISKLVTCCRVQFMQLSPNLCYLGAYTLGIINLLGNRLCVPRPCVYRVLDYMDINKIHFYSCFERY
jgi:hypothetical protein